MEFGCLEDMLYGPVTPELNIAKVVATIERNKLLNLETLLKEKIIGQDAAIESVCRAIRRSRAGLKDDAKPVGVFLFMGNTGIGKTELCKALAEVLYGDKKRLLRLDMSEYSSRWDIVRMTGAAPGYLGHENGGQLTNMVKENPQSVLCIDEIEKVHPDVYNIFLQIFDDGILTSSQGETVSFKDILIIMTSNIGSDELANGDKPIGFAKYNKVDSKSKLDSALKQTFKPEFLGRIDEVITFNKLNVNHIFQICGIMLNELKQRAAKVGITVEFDKSVAVELVRLGYSEKYGVRPLKRVISAKIEDLLADKIISGELKSGEEIRITFNENGFESLKKKSRKKSIKTKSAQSFETDMW